MSKRFRMGKRQSQKSFRRNASPKKKNIAPPPMRGGIRL